MLFILVLTHNILLFAHCRAVTDPRDGRRVALKKLPNVFQSLVSSKRVFRELKMLCYFKHENVSVYYVIRHMYETHAGKPQRPERVAVSINLISLHANAPNDPLT